jgi:hypothetical protein
MWVTKQRLVAVGGGLMVAADILVIGMLFFLRQILVVPQFFFGAFNFWILTA